MKRYVERLLRFSFWADQRCFAALQATPAAHPEALPLFAHVLAAEHVWLQRLQHRQPHHAVWPVLSIDECAVLVKDNEAGYREFMGQLAEDQLNGSVHYRTSQGLELESTVLDILTQVVTHGPYHHGQIAKVIGRCGGNSIITDYIVFSRELE